MSTKWEIAFGVGYDWQGKPIPADELREALEIIERRASREFGGCSLIAGRGSWVDDSRLIQEESRVLFIFTEDSPQESEHRIERIAGLVKGELRQKSVIVSWQIVGYKMI
jgi:hypothetical protein